MASLSDKTRRVVFWNVRGWGETASVKGEETPFAYRETARAEVWPRELLKTRADAIVLCEVFGQDVNELANKVLRSDYPYVTHNGFGGGVEEGLQRLSKHEPRLAAAVRSNIGTLLFLSRWAAGTQNGRKPGTVLQAYKALQAIRATVSVGSRLITTKNPRVFEAARAIVNSQTPDEVAKHFKDLLGLSADEHLWSGGLVVFSKHPFVAYPGVGLQFKPYSNTYGAQRFAELGFLSATIMLDREVPVHLFGTHVQEGKTREQILMREKHVGELLAPVQKMNIPQGAGRIIMGDFNICAERSGPQGIQATEEYLSFMRRFEGFRDAFRVAHPDPNEMPGATFHNGDFPCLTAEKGDQRLDLMLVDGAIKVVNVHVIEDLCFRYGPYRGGFLSDHRPVIMDFQVEDSPERWRPKNFALTFHDWKSRYRPL